MSAKDEEEINNDRNDSVESLLDAFEDDDGEHRVVDDSLEKETPTDPEKDSENDIEQSPEAQEEHVPLVTESSVEEEGGDGDDSGESNPSDLIDILDDSDISDNSDQEEDEDMELGMDTLDETKDEELSDLELDTTEIEESVDLDVPAIDTSDETKEVDISDESKEDEINLSINNLGFKATANKFSISDTAKFAGVVGKIKENQLSEEILNKIKDIEIGEYTNPIKVGNGFLILMINKKNLITSKLNEEEILRDMIDFETNKQLNQFSQIYFNKIKLNSQIDEL